MYRFSSTVLIFGLMGLIGSPLMAAPPAEVELRVINFREGQKVEFQMVPSQRVPGSLLTAKVEFQEGQHRIEISYNHMQPAVVFGGDISCYVLWAVNREGTYENLGEFWVRPEKRKHTMGYSTGLRNFALLVTAEPYYLVRQPSEMVITYNGDSQDPRARSTPLTFSDFGPMPRHEHETLATARYDSEAPMDILQAERVYELAGRLGAGQYARDIYQQADIRLQQARQMSKSSGAKKGTQEFARRSVANSNDAIQISVRRQQAAELEEAINQQLAEMDQMKKRAAAAEADASRTREEANRAEAAVRASRAELERMQRDKAVIATERAVLESVMADLRREKGVLEGRLQNALSRVADTRKSARGYILNLPDILFDIGKASLKPEARERIAKLAGILLIMQEQNLQVEGHTDSTGTYEFNLSLSENRAQSVVNFMAQHGVQHNRMRATGYGVNRPVSDNATAECRRKNRRVEIILFENELAATALH